MADLSLLEKRIAEADKKAAEALAALKQLKARRAQIEAQQRAMEAKKKRAEENQRKFQAGGLVQLAGLLDADKGFLLGALLMAADRKNDADFFVNVKLRGDKLLAEREHDRKSKSTQQNPGKEQQR